MASAGTRDPTTVSTPFAQRPPPVWHTLTIPEVVARTESRLIDGLSSPEAAHRLARTGLNVLPSSRGRTPWRMLADQFTDLMVVVLLTAAVIATLLGERQDVIAILAIVSLNGLLGFVQEYRADRALSALRALATPVAQVRRDGQWHSLPAAHVVPGDLVGLDAGGRVPADLRLVEAWRLRLDESALTGESEATFKQCAPIPAEHTPLGDRTNLAFTGTMVTAGRGTGVVVATGPNTELGRIAALVSEHREQATPLQRRLANLGRQLAVGVLGICAVVFLHGLWRHEPLVPMFMTAMSLAVAAIPEALPAVVTVLLAFGARRLARQGALVRRLSAVETLGSVTCIGSDKTGTLTENAMRVETVVLVDGRPDAADVLRAHRASADAMLETMARCNDATRLPDGTFHGEATETALLRAVAEAGRQPEDWPVAGPRVAELPFTPERARMTTLFPVAYGVRAFTKGAPERVIPACTAMWSTAGALPIDREALLAQAHALASTGLRVLAFAQRDLAALPADIEDVEDAQHFVGLVGLLDPPRSTAASAVADCHRAGVQVVMITGDHPRTARAIATRLGILFDDDSQLLTGVDVAAMSETQLADAVPDTAVFARVTAEDKDRIVGALQRRGALVAMTGDGVNDAPALRRADIGIAMGRSGTDAAREAAHMVLLDDDFTTIVAAVREGRRIQDNLRKFVRFVLTGNAGELWVLLLAPLLGLPLPLLPIHLLWINLVTDGLPGLAFATEHAESDVMHRPPRPPFQSLFAEGLGRHILWVGLLLGGVTLTVQAIAWRGGAPHWQSMTFTVLTLAQLAHALCIRSERTAIWTTGITSNRPLLGAVLLTVALQSAVLYVPALQVLFRTNALSLGELSWCGAATLVVVAGVEADKWRLRRQPGPVSATPRSRPPIAPATPGSPRRAPRGTA